MTPRALADTATSNLAARTNSSSARAAVGATIVERRSFSCDRAQHAGTAEITAFPRLAEDHSHLAVALRFGCFDLKRTFEATAETAPARAATPQPGSAPALLIDPVGTNSWPSAGITNLSRHRHVIEFIYNFE